MSAPRKSIRLEVGYLGPFEEIRRRRESGQKRPALKALRKRKKSGVRAAHKD